MPSQGADVYAGATGEKAEVMEQGFAAGVSAAEAEEIARLLEKEQRERSAGNGGGAKQGSGGRG
jgi:hypothetical protein